MTQGESFKHITVTAPEEDDVVIFAGATPAEEPEAHESIEEPAEVSEPVVQPQTAAPMPAAPAKPKADTYHETTLDDLTSTPMPLAQRIVIVAAIVCIIGAVIYCAFFMG
ncbi:MAG: SURF2 Surfeit locus protein 2 [Eggerthellaceae bacterium]|nr:SURF2 Surfeit locus protein 2 [Eggerthellaceae bacterium]